MCPRRPGRSVVSSNGGSQPYGSLIPPRSLPIPQPLGACYPGSPRKATVRTQCCSYTSSLPPARPAGLALVRTDRSHGSLRCTGGCAHMRARVRARVHGGGDFFSAASRAASTAAETARGSSAPVATSGCSASALRRTQKAHLGPQSALIIGSRLMRFRPPTQQVRYSAISQPCSRAMRRLCRLHRC